MEKKYPELDGNELNLDFPKSDIEDINNEEDEWLKAELANEDEAALNSLEYPDDGEVNNIKKMKEALEDNEDEVECKVCFDLFPKADCHKTEDGYICKACEQAQHSHQGTNLDLIDADPFDLEYDDPRRTKEEEPKEEKNASVNGTEIRKFEAGIEENLNEHWWDDDDPMNWSDKEPLVYKVYYHGQPMGYAQFDYRGHENYPADEEIIKLAKQLDTFSEFPEVNDSDITWELDNGEWDPALETVEESLQEDTLTEATTAKTLDDKYKDGYELYRGQEKEPFRKVKNIKDAVALAKATSKDNNYRVANVKAGDKTLIIFEKGKEFENNLKSIAQAAKIDNKINKKEPQETPKAEEPKADEKPAKTAAKLTQQEVTDALLKTYPNNAKQIKVVASMLKKAGLTENLEESQSQEIGDTYKRISNEQGIDLDELVYGDDGFMKSCYPEGFPDFRGDVIYSAKYWEEFENWLKETKGIVLKEHINDRPADIESDQKNFGVDNAVVDCKKYTLVAHSEDEKPVDCKMEKPALEKPLAGEEVDIKVNEELNEAKKTNKFIEVAESLAKKAAKDWDNASPEERAFYKEQGTSILFEKYQEEYNKILYACSFFDEEDLEAAGIDISGDEEEIDEAAFWYLDELLWKYTTIDESLQEAKKDDDEILPENLTEDFDSFWNEVNSKQEWPISELKAVAKKNNIDLSKDPTILSHIEGKIINDEPLAETLVEEKEIPDDFSDIIDYLNNDETEAVDGYEEATDKIDAKIDDLKKEQDAADEAGDYDTYDEVSDEVNTLEVAGDTLTHIKKEEQEHKDELDGIARNIKDAGMDDFKFNEAYPDVPFDSEAKEGDTIRIIHLEGEDNSYDGKVGKVDHIDGIGQLHGTWGGLAVIPGVDDFVIVENESLNEDVLDDFIKNLGNDDPVEQPAKQSPALDAEANKEIDSIMSTWESLHEDANEEIKCAICGEMAKKSDCRPEGDLGLICPKCMGHDDTNESLKEAKEPGDKEASYNAGLKLAALHNKPVIYGYSNKARNGKFFALDNPIICDNVFDETKKFKAQYKNSGTVYVAYPGDYVEESLTEDADVDYVEYMHSYCNALEPHMDELRKIDNLEELKQAILNIVNGDKDVNTTHKKNKFTWLVQNKKWASPANLMAYLDKAMAKAKSIEVKVDDNGELVKQESLKEGIEYNKFSPEEQAELGCDEDGYYDRGRYVFDNWCGDIFDESECGYEVDFGWLCPQCQAALKSHGETLTFIENESLTETMSDEAGIWDPITNKKIVTFSPKIEAIWKKVIKYANDHNIDWYKSGLTAEERTVLQKRCIEAVCTPEEMAALRTAEGDDGKTYSAYSPNWPEI